MLVLNFLNVLNFTGDSPRKMQRTFQDPATDYMISIFSFNIHLLTLIVTIIIFVGWMMTSVLTSHLEMDRSEVGVFYHSNVIEMVWTTIPALVLICLAYPSLTLLYSFDENVPIYDLHIRITGHQWYWEYYLSEAAPCLDQTPSHYSAYFLSDEILRLDISGLKRTLEVDRRLVVPFDKILKLAISGVDVLHSWTVPSFGIKVDACPGRVSYASLKIKRVGLYFGQCSEICGVNHGFMPISVLALPTNFFNNVVHRRVNDITHIF